MGASDWSLVKEVLADALDQPEENRSTWLDRRCGDDTALRCEVASLLQATTEAGSFIEAPALPGLNPGEEVDPHIGRTLGPYVIDRCLGRGGMGTVYLASRADHEFEQRVAIKMIRRGMDSDLVVRRFRHERQILASLDHPHIARLFDGGTTPDGLPYFVMEYVDGVPIDRYADEHRLTTPDRLRLCLAVLDAVQHAHEHHVIHRDLKPSNVLVTANGHPKLLDFGIAKILNPEAVADSTFTSLARPMTPEYASPEQVRGEPVTAATDVYALGLMLYEILTGHRAYRLGSRTPDAIARVVCEQDPERPSTVITRVETTVQADGTSETATPESVSETRDGTPEALRQRLSGSLDAVVMKALRKPQALRYPTVAALADDIRRWLDERPVEARRDALVYGATRWVRRRRAALSVAALLLLAVTATAVAVGRWTRATPAAGIGAADAVGTRPSVAVAGFSNLAGAPADQWLSTALAEMLTTELAGGGQLRVAPAERVTRAARDLSVDSADAPDAAAVDRLRSALGTDYLVVGSFAVGGSEGPRDLRIDIRVVRAADDPIAMVAAGDESRLFAMVADLGRDLRRRLGLPDNAPEATESARAAFPRSLDATRLYAEGLARLRLLDAVSAQQLLTEAASHEPDNPLIHAALVSAWAALGYDVRAEQAARRAFETSSALTREDRLNAEGRLYEAEKSWPKAVDVYRTLWGFFSDNIEYGLRLAAVQTSAGRGADALVTVDEMRRAPAPHNADPRLDLAEAQAAAALGEYPRELAAVEQALQRASEAGARLVVARALLAKGRSLYNQGDAATAGTALEAARDAFQTAGDRAGEASALNSLAVVASDTDAPRSKRMYEESLAISEQIGDRRGMSAALNNLGIFLKDQNRLDEALAVHQRALALRREIDDRNWTAISLSNIGVVLFEQDRLQEATKYYRESLDLTREIGDKRGQVRALHNMAIVERELGRLAEARADYETSIAMRAEIGDRRGRVVGGVELTAVLLQLGDLAAARQSAEETLRAAGDVQFAQAEAQAIFLLGEIAIAAGDLSEARRHHERALARRLEIQETRTVLESRLALAALDLEEGRPSDAAREAAAVAQAMGKTTAPLLVQTELVAARAYVAANRLTDAARSFAAGERLAKSSERVSLQVALALAGAEIDLARGDRARARDRLSALEPIVVRAGMRLADLERRLLLLRVERAERPGGGHPEAQALEQAARALGAGLILSRLQLP
jgi:serine/threonine protein kinase/tetratricopeptide (TPR) repeat protein/TolB-like protein